MNDQSSFQLVILSDLPPADTRRRFNVNKKLYDIVSTLRRRRVSTGVDHLVLGLPESIKTKRNAGNIVKNKRVLRIQLYLMNII